MILDPLQDGKSSIQLLSSMGSDLDIANDARASFEKVSESLSAKDVKLIRYLLTSKPAHNSPLRGVVFKFKVKAPLAICRQWWKHVVASNHTDEQLGWNEKSFRYTEADDEGDFYIPWLFRLQSQSNKQSSEGVLDIDANKKAIEIFSKQCADSFKTYQELRSLGVCREQARLILNPAVYTSWVWTASLESVLNFLFLRRGNGAQHEISSYAIAINYLIKPIVPETLDIWNELNPG